MKRIVGVTGTAVTDHFFSATRVSHRNDSYWITSSADEFRVDLATPASGDRKSFARFDRGLLAHADFKRFGGGGYNSSVEMARITPEIEIRYSDSGMWNAELETDLAAHQIYYRSRALYPILDNVVTGDPQVKDKLVFKSAAPWANESPFEDQFEWISEGGTVLINSDKHRAWVTRLASAAARHIVDLHVVLTPSLSGDYLIDTLIPHARVVVAGLDELGAALGVAVRNSLEGGLDALRMLAERAHSPVIHLTLGKEGALVSDPEEMAVFHVRLNSAKSQEVRAHLRDHSGVCGCGDCYAGAATLYSVTGRSVFGDLALSKSRFVSASIAGCAAAVRRLGYNGTLCPHDFVVANAGDLSVAHVGTTRRIEAR